MTLTPHTPWADGPTGIGEVQVGQEGTLARGTQTCGHRVDRFLPTLAPIPSVGSPNSQPHQPSSWRPAVSLQRQHHALAASHTPHTHSLLNPHPTSRPPEVQTFKDPPFQTPQALIHTFTLRPTHPHTRLQTKALSPRGDVQSEMCPDLNQDRFPTPRTSSDGRARMQASPLLSLPLAGWGFQDSLLLLPPPPPT